jgi:hypothetical protein
MAATVPQAKIMKHISWHTFRRTFSNAAEGQRRGHQDGARELLRHANSRITLEIYTQAVTPAKRAAQTKVVEMILLKPKEQKELEETLGKARILLSNPSEPTPRAGSVSA